MARKPDDPRECCRRITRELLPLTDYPNEEAPTEFARLVEILASVEENDAEAWERSRHALGIFATYAKNAAEAKTNAVDHALDLARVGSGDDGPGAELKSVGSDGAT